MNGHAAARFPDDLREALAQALYDCERTDGEDRAAWTDTDLEARHPGLRERYRRSADALAAGPLADLMAARHADEEELRVLRRQRMSPERERELLEANNRLVARAEAAETARHTAEEALATLRRERDVAREAEAFWQQFAFDADDLATRRLIEQTDARAEAELDDVRREVDGIRNTVRTAGSTFNPVQTIRDELKGAVEGRAKMGPEKMGPEMPGPETPPVETRSLADATAQLKAEQEAAAAPHAADTHPVTPAGASDHGAATEVAEAPLPVPGSVDDPFGPPPDPPAAHPATEESKNGTAAR